LAFADIKDKKDLFQQHIVAYNTNDFNKILEKERELKLMELNGDNNKNFTKDVKYLKYVSAARTMKVIMRFFNFLIFTFEEI
jgi:site-specific recombinase XerD